MPTPSRGRRRAGIPRRPQSRAPYRYNRAVRDVEFVQRVRRHTPSSLVPLVARYGAAFADRKAYLKADSAVFAPWVLAEVARAPRIADDVVAGLSLPAAVPVGYGPCAESPASDLLWRLAAGDCLMGVQLGLMGVQLGGKVIWAGLRGCGCGAGTAGQQREAVTVLP